MGSDFGGGLSTSFTDINTGLFGNDSDTNMHDTGQTVTKNSKDSGQTRNTNTATTNSGNIVTNSGNTSTVGGGRNVVTDSGRINKNSDTTSTSGDTYSSGRQDKQVIGGRHDVQKNSGRTDVQQLMISEEGVNHLIRTVLEGVKGLAATTTGEKVTGLYNSSVNTMLTNDLLSRVSGEVAARAAPLVSKIGESSTTNDIGEQVINTSIGSSYTSNSSASNRSGIELIGSSSQVTDIADRINTTGPTSITTGASTSNTTGTDVIGPRTLDETQVISARDVSTSVDSKGLLDWIICTELRKQGKMRFSRYVFGSRKFAEYDEKIKRGYYIWAVPSVHHMRKHPNSLYTKFLEIWFNARAEHIMKLAGTTYKKSALNSIAYYGTHAFCWILSRTIAADYTYTRSSVYGESYGG